MTTAANRRSRYSEHVRRCYLPISAKMMFHLYRKSSNRSPRLLLEQLETRLVFETQLLLEGLWNFVHGSSRVRRTMQCN